MEKQIDRYSYELGVMDCFCEMVSAGLKTMALSHTFDSCQIRDQYLEAVEKLCRKYRVHFYCEDEAFITDLFPEELCRGKCCFIFYRQDETLSSYLDLKKKKAEWISQGDYEGSGRQEIARAYGKLLSYPDEGIERLMQQAGTR